MNNKQNYLLIVVLAIALPLKAQEPRWVNYITRNSLYPSSQYLTGFASEINNQNTDQNELLNKLEGIAKDQLVENIMVDIRSISTLNIHNVNEATQESFKHSSTSFSQAKIAGLKVEKYYDSKKKTAYRFAYTLKSEVLKLYENEIEQQVSLIQTASAAAVSLDKPGALKKYFETQAAFRKIEEAQTLITTLTAKFDSPSLKRALVSELQMSIESKISALKNARTLTLDEAAYFLAFALHTQTNSVKAPVKLANFTYQDTPMGSAFSRRFRNALEQSLLSEAFYEVADVSQKNQAFVLNGTYWEETDKLKITAVLRAELTGEAVASASCYIPLAVLQQSNIDFKPENYKNALLNMKLFAKDELKGGELQVEILTNKGQDAQLFTEGESMKLFVRANRECYLRFVYHLADGAKVLLLDNYYINSDKVNQVYELPYDFECAEPFGVETLQLNAQTETFQKLLTTHENGYDFIQENTEQILSKTRGFKKKEGLVLSAEQILVFTTLKK